MNNLQVVLLIQRSHCHDLKKEKEKVKVKKKEQRTYTSPTAVKRRRYDRHPVLERPVLLCLLTSDDGRPFHRITPWTKEEETPTKVRWKGT
jgi:hypothetical protein